MSTDNTTLYIKSSIAKCRARSILFHTKANRWGAAHWAMGIINAVSAATVSALSVVSQQQGWGNDVGIFGGLALTVLASAITALKFGKNQKENETAGDDYSNLENKIFSQFMAARTDEDLIALHNYCTDKLNSYMNRYEEPSPSGVAVLERDIMNTLFSSNHSLHSVVST